MLSREEGGLRGERVINVSVRRGHTQFNPFMVGVGALSFFLWKDCLLLPPSKDKTINYEIIAS